VSTPRAPLSRRTALALALSTPLVLTGCDLDPPSAAPSEPPTSAPLPDTEVVASARKAILLTVALLEVVSARHRPLRADIRSLLDLHTAHLEVLDDGSEDQDQGLEAALPADTPAMARTQVSGAEGNLAATLADAARQAASGDLARALASMSAAIAQRVAP
jgi:hypothetical protein